MGQKDRFDLVWKTLAPYLKSPEGWKAERSGDGVPSRYLMLLCGQWTYLTRANLQVHASPFTVKFSASDFPEITEAFEQFASAKDSEVSLDEALKKWAECAAN